MQIIPTMYLFVPDMQAMEQIFDAQAEIYGDNRSYKHDYYGFDLSCDDEMQIRVAGTLREKVQELTRWKAQRRNAPDFTPYTAGCFSWACC